MTSLGSMLSISCAAKTRVPDTSVSTSQTTILLVHLPSVRPGASSCGCSQREGRATAIVDSSVYFRRESRIPSTANNSGVSGGRASPAIVVSVHEGYKPAEFEGSGVSCSPSVGREGSDCVPNRDAQESPVPSTRGTGTGEAILPPMLGSPRFMWTADGPTGTVEGRTRGDVRVAREMGIEAAFEDSVFLAARDSYVVSCRIWKANFS